jgi:hypothetical protein
MEIKDISVSVERLDDVRGGQNINVGNFGFQVGGNKAASAAASYGLGNQTSSATNQYAAQDFSQTTAISAVEVDKKALEIYGSLIGF